MIEFDTVIANGKIFDGTGEPEFIGWVGIKDKRVAVVGRGNKYPDAIKVIDATGKWVIPGFVDIHTHYDVEVLESPSLNESARHGTTTIIMGNCSLSTIWATPEDCADLFSRVEALPWQNVYDGVKRHQNWTNPQEYVEYINTLPLGVNVAAFIGHSDIRVSVMGLERSVDPEITPTADEYRQMKEKLRQALNAGFVGISTLRNSNSKVDGNRMPTRRLPSTYSSWKEYNALFSIVRKKGRIHQGNPSKTRPFDSMRFFLSSTGLGRKALKTTLLTAADLKSNRKILPLILFGAKMVNTFLRGNLLWQHLPVDFTLYADGVDLVILEELGTGTEALNIRNAIERTPLLADPDYRARFAADIKATTGIGSWHRDLNEATVFDAPDSELKGKSFAQIAKERGEEPSDTFLDLVIEYGPKLRWKTTVSGDREEVLDKMIYSSQIQIGFADSGAHLRNMAFYNASLRLVERISKRADINMAYVIRRLTGELADWYGLDVGYIRKGARADIAILDPAGFTGESAEYHEAYIPEFGVSRMVNRNDNAVSATLVGGTIVWENGMKPEGIGTTIKAGEFLCA